MENKPTVPNGYQIQQDPFGRFRWINTVYYNASHGNFALGGRSNGPVVWSVNEAVFGAMQDARTVHAGIDQFETMSIVQ